MSNATFTPIAEGSAATPGLFNSRYQEVSESLGSSGLSIKSPVTFYGSATIHKILSDTTDNTFQLSAGPSSSSQDGASILMYGEGHASTPGRIRLVTGASGRVTLESDQVTVDGQFVIGNTQGVDVSPTSDLSADLITVNVSDVPKLTWDEDVDHFKISKGLSVPDGAALTNPAISRTSNASTGIAWNSDTAQIVSNGNLILQIPTNNALDVGLNYGINLNGDGTAPIQWNGAAGINSDSTGNFVVGNASVAPKDASFGLVLLNEGAPGTEPYDIIANKQDVSLASNATIGFFSIPSIADHPVGTPTNRAQGYAQVVFNRNDNTLCVWDNDSSSWISTGVLS